MTWFKVDDSFWRSGKVRRLGEKYRVPAVGLWTLSGDWSADNLTDGFVPWEVLEQWDPDRRLSERLLVVGLWVETERDDEVGVMFHDWEDWQPTREQVQQRRKADADRRARWREAQRNRRAGGRGPDDDPGGVRPVDDRDAPPESHDTSQRESQRASRRDARRESRPVSSLPDPTRPDPTRPERNNYPPPPVRDSRTDRAPARRGGGEHATATELNRTAHTPGAARIVAAWAADQPGLTKPKQRELAKAVDTLLAQGADPELIPDALDRAHTPRWRNPVAGLPHAYEDTRRTRNPAAVLAATGTDRIPTTTARVNATLALLRPDED